MPIICKHPGTLQTKAICLSYEIIFSDTISYYLNGFRPVKIIRCGAMTRDEPNPNFLPAFTSILVLSGGKTLWDIIITAWRSSLFRSFPAAPIGIGFYRETVSNYAIPHESLLMSITATRRASGGRSKRKCRLPWQTEKSGGCTLRELHLLSTASGASNHDQFRTVGQPSGLKFPG